MRITQFLKIAPMLYKNGISVHIESHPGIGKSDMLEKDIPRVMKEALGVDEFQVKLVNLTSYEAPDVRGFCVPVKDTDGTMRARFTQSPLIPSNPSQHGMMFFDEFSQASADVQKPMADVLLHGRVGESTLPAGWARWSAGNLMSSRAGVVKALSHVTNRRVVIPLDFHIDDWTAWAFDNGIHPLFIAAANFKPGMLTENVPDEPVPFCTPRSFSNMAKLCQEYAGGHINEAIASDSVILEIATGTVGKAAAAQSLAFMRVCADLPSWDDVVRDPVGSAKRLPAGRMDVVHAATTMVVHNATKDTIGPVFEFVTQLPKEFQTAAVAMLFKRLGGVALNHPLYSAWVAANPHLIVATLG